MYSHTTIGTNALEPAMRFYDGVMAALGHQRFYTFDKGAGYGANEAEQLWILSPFDGQEAHAGNGVMIAFMAPNRAAVDAAFEAAMAAGGQSEGEPGLRPQYHDNYYGAYMRDPDGNKLCVVCHNPE